MMTAVEMLRLAREAYSAEDRSYTRGATGTPQGGQFATGGGAQTTGPAPKPAAKPVPKPVAKKPAAKPAAKKPPTTLEQASTRLYADFGTLSERTPANDSRVRDAQVLMASLGMKTPIDGNFGPAMTAQVKAMQTKLGIHPTGRMTSSLMKKLQSAAILSPCAKAVEGVTFTAADLLARAREGFNPDQLRAEKGTGIGGRWVSMRAVVAALRGKGHHDAADSLGHLDTPAVSGHHGPTRRPASHTPKIARGGDRVGAEHLGARLGVLNDEHGARQHDGSPMADPEARRRNRLQADQLHATLAPMQGRVATEDAIAADNRETRNLLGDVPEGDHLAAARAHVAAMQGGAPAAPSAEPLSAEPATRAAQVDNRVRAAYAHLAAKPGDWVGLADLRNELGEDVNRHEVDASLKRFLLADGSNVVPESNQKTLTQADRDAAVSIGDQAKHAIMIEDPSPRPLSLAAPSTPDARSTSGPSFDAAPTVGYEARPTADGWATYAVAGNGATLLIQHHDTEAAAKERAAGFDAQVQKGGGASEPWIAQNRAMGQANHAARAAAAGQAAPVKKTAAAKLARAKASKRPPADVVADMQSASSREEAAAHLEGQTVGDLRAIADAGGIAVGSKDSRDKLKSTIVQWTAGRRLDSDAIGPAPKTYSTDGGGRISQEEAGRRMFGDAEYERRAAKTAARKAAAKAAPAKAPAEPGASGVTRYDSRKVGGQWGVYAVGPDGSSRLVEPAGSEGAANNRAGNMDAALGGNRAPRAAAAPAAPAPVAPAKKTAVAKMARAKAAKASPEEVHAQLATLTDREEARGMLSKMTMAELKAVNPSAGTMARNKADLVDLIVEGSVGQRLDRAAQTFGTSGHMAAPRSFFGSEAGAPTPPASVDHASIADQVKAAQSEDDVRRLLQEQKLTVADLKTIAGHVGGPSANPKGTKQQIIDKIAAGSNAGLVNRPATVFAGDWNQGATTVPSTPSVPTPISPEEAKRRADILAAPRGEARGMRPEDGAGVFSADSEIQRRSASALNAESDASRANGRSSSPGKIQVARSYRELSDVDQFHGRNLTAEGRAALEALGPAGHPDIAAIPDTEGKIRAAHKMLAIPGNGGSDYVALEDLRALIGNQASRADVDDTLRQMNQQPGVFVRPQSYAREVRTEQRLAAAVEIGMQERNLLQIIPGAAPARPTPAPPTPAPSRPTAAQKMTRAKAATDGLIERAGLAESESEIVGVLQGATSATQLKRVATGLGIKVPSSMRSTEEIRAFVARSLAAFGS